MPQVETEHRAVVDMPAVQARMLLKNQSYLNPTETTQAPLLNNDTVAQFANRNYGLFEDASRRERRAQSNETETYAIKYQRWSEGVSTCFGATVNKAKMETLKPLFVKIGIMGPQMESADIQGLYDRYFNSNLSSSGIKTFVKDVLDTYKVEGKVDLAAIERDRESLQWMSELFGGTSSEMISQLILSEAKLLADPHCFETLNKTIHTVTEPEKKLMGFIYDKKVDEEVHAIENGQLPVEKRKEDIQNLLRDPDVDKIVISAGTGAGKTTKIPQYIYELLGPGEKAAVTQPRRIATQALAETVRKQMGIEKFGDEVGYAHGKGREANKNTSLLFTTEKSLLIQLSRDQRLLKYNYVMVDEWHERHKDTDMLVALLQKAQALRKKAGDPPLKLIITSATMNREDLVRQLGDRTKSLEIEGNSHTIESRFWKQDNNPLTRDVIPQRSVGAVLDLVQTRASDRNILIFMPGDALISQTYDALVKLKDKLLPNVVIDRLTGSMTREEQERVIKVNNVVNGKEVSDGKKHIIICSPIAETSLTVARVDVISSGLVNISHDDPHTGLHYLTETLHSKYGLRQQKGRTGRESDGIWYYLGSEDEYKKLGDRHDPEIVSSDLSNEILLLKKIGYAIDEIPLVDKEKLLPEHIARAKRRLKELGAFDRDERITDIGREMLEIPEDVHFSRMLVEAKKRGCVRDAATIVTVCNQTDLFERIEGKGRNLPAEALNSFATKADTSDFIVRLRMFNEFKKQGKDESDETKREELRKEWAATHHFRYETLQRIEDELADLLDRLDYKETGTEAMDEAALSQCVYEGFKDCLFKKTGTKKDREREVSTYTLENEPVTTEQIDRSSILPRDTQQFISAGGNVRNPYYARINQVVTSP